jgi:hypothetical protein
MKPIIKYYFQEEGSYLFCPNDRHAPLFLGESNSDERSLYKDLSDVCLLLRTDAIGPTLKISDNLLQALVKPGQPLKFCVAVNTVTHSRASQALQRKPDLPLLWFSISSNDENSGVLKSLLSIKPNPKYKRCLIYYWSQAVAADLREVSLKYLNSIDFVISANCTKKVTVFEVPQDFLKFILLSKKGLDISVLNERTGRF